MKKVLITSTDLMMVQFLIPHVKNLCINGFEVDVACSNVGGRMREVKDKIGSYTKAIHEVRLKRNPLSPVNIIGYGDMKRVFENSYYDLVWTNEPVMGVVTRLCAQRYKKQGTKVIYMVHGFHFFRGAPPLNWMLYYPIEKLMAHYADLIVTVNTEDYERAQAFNVKSVEYIHGIGIDTDRLSLGNCRGNIREELGIDKSSFIVLSVGELNKNKNQKTIINAFSLLQDPSVHYVLCGKGKMHETLVKLAAGYGLQNNIHFLGYRTDVLDICCQADLYVMPSYREGLPVSSLEAMYCGLPLLTSNIRGLVDVNKDGYNGFLYSPSDAIGFAQGIKKMKENPTQRKTMGERNRAEVIPFTIDNTKKEFLRIVEDLLD